MSFCSTSCSIPLVTVHSAVHSKSDALCCTLNCQNKEKAVEKVFLQTKKKILKKAVSLYLLTSTAQQPSVMFDTYGQIWDVPAVPAYCHSSTPSCLQKAHTLTLHSTSCFPSPLYSTLSCPSPVPSAHLTAYPGRTLGDSATGGCGRAFPLHGTA